MKSAARPRNETTRLSALATGLRLTMTDPPKISISNAKVQKRNGGISLNFEFVRSFLLVPFQYDAVHDTADLKQFLLVMHHLGAGEAGDGVIFPQKNRLLGTDLFAHAAENAADHVDIEFLGVLLDFGEAVVRRDFVRNNFDRARRTDNSQSWHATQRTRPSSSRTSAGAPR